jgi:hypothetical protein
MPSLRELFTRWLSIHEKAGSGSLPTCHGSATLNACVALGISFFAFRGKISIIRFNPFAGDAGVMNIKNMLYPDPDSVHLDPKHWFVERNFLWNLVLNILSRLFLRSYLSTESTSLHSVGILYVKD